jgi:hypothetical protein
MLTFDDTTNLERLKIFQKGVVRNEDPSSYGEFQLVLQEGDILAPKVEALEPLKLQCHKFLEYVRNGKYPPELESLELKVMRVLDGAQRSLGLGGTPISIHE